jgi:hypothetical protein
MGRFYLTYDDAIAMTLGTATEGIFSYVSRRATERPDGTAWYPNFPMTCVVGSTAILIGYSTLSTTTPKISRFWGGFILGFGISQFISYMTPHITGGEESPYAIDTASTPGGVFKKEVKSSITAGVLRSGMMAGLSAV